MKRRSYWFLLKFVFAIIFFFLLSAIDKRNILRTVGKKFEKYRIQGNWIYTLKSTNAIETILSSARSTALIVLLYNWYSIIRVFPPRSKSIRKLTITKQIYCQYFSLDFREKL